jgi:hypothetical protein
MIVHTSGLLNDSVAELARKPLYRVTCGDIGTNVDAIDKVYFAATQDFYRLIFYF